MFNFTDALREACKHARESNGLTINHVAIHLHGFKRPEVALTRFEKGEAGPTFPDLNGLIAAYATATGERPSTILVDAIRRAQSESPASDWPDEEQRARMLDDMLAEMERADRQVREA